ncbi:TRAPP subunit [Malassezia brasiliensis]|uniref:TRAPP subunit n=1 Tax=Malassezia brasiliensis TaxID=1821822 RepID=A0AAF0DXR9_9BASI|nr:TRAPP subunit [Malassezia brasiliensis]
MPYYFCIVGTRDNLLYEADLSITATTPTTQAPSNTEQTRNSGIFGFSSAFDAKFIILHEHKHEDGIRNFLMDVWELWVKITMNPFQDLNDPIRSPAFDARLRAAARKHL